MHELASDAAFKNQLNFRHSIVASSFWSVWGNYEELLQYFEEAKQIQQEAKRETFLYESLQ